MYEFSRFTSVIVLNEVFHKTAIADAKKSFNIPLKNIVTFLKRNPEKFKSLNQPWVALENIVRIPNLIILEVDFNIYGLLSNDALHLAVMKENNLVNLASNDLDFGRVEWINLY